MTMKVKAVVTAVGPGGDIRKGKIYDNLPPERLKKLLKIGYVVPVSGDEEKAVTKPAEVKATTRKKK